MFQGNEGHSQESAGNIVQSPWESEHWSRLQELFHLAETAPSREWNRILHDACSDSALVERVLELLAASSDKPISRTPIGELVPLGTRVGPYALLRHLGTGGLGSVYLAERMVGGAVQKCALKVLSMHAAGPQFELRFQREQQILAMLNHPHITRLFDAGFSETNQPYLIMEYVDGVDVVCHCDENELCVAQRLELFLQICDAVAYAHRNLTVHLDLKPSNVLVSTDGEVKLLDFGTSKLIDPDSTLTTTVLATPAYAAPEQLRNEPVTTACDVYTLGAILFELLSGQRPGRDCSATRLFERAFSEAEPQLLTDSVSDNAAAARGMSVERLRQVLGGDLETIVSKCLRSRPGDRYPSVDALTDDLKRFQQEKPVLARPQTFAYRFGKFTRRNRAAVLTSAISLLLLLSVAVYAAWRQEQAVRQGRRAEQMQTFLYRLLYVANTNYMGKPSFSVPDFLELGARLVPSYVTNPSDLRRAQLGIAESMFENDDAVGAARVFAEVVRSAKVARDFNSEAEAEATGGYIAFEDGNIAQGKAMTAHALELSRRSSATRSVSVWSRVYYVMVRDESGSRTDANLRLLQDAVQDAADGPLQPRDVADAHYNLALAYQYRSRYADSESAYRQALRTYDRDPGAQCDRADVHRGIAKDEEDLGRDAESLSQYEKAWSESKNCSGPNSQGSLQNETYVVEGLLRAGRPAEALSMMRSVVQAFRKLGIAGPRLNRPLWLLGEAYVAQGRFAAADALLREAVADGNYDERAQGPEFGLLQLVWAKALQGEGRKAEALSHAKEAQRLLPTEENTLTEKQSVAQTHELIAALSPK